MFKKNNHDLVSRYEGNPIITPKDVKVSRKGFEVVGAFNAGAFEYRGRIGLLLRVAERPVQRADRISVPCIDFRTGKVRVRYYERSVPGLNISDPRIVLYKEEVFLTSLSHLRLAWSSDGVHFIVDRKPTLWPEGEYETYGIEDPRVAKIGMRYYISYSAVSEHEVGVGLAWTADWQKFHREGLILHPFNKDTCLFQGAKKNRYWVLHRPSGVMWPRNWMWISESQKLTCWGRPRCLARTRPGKFDSVRLGAGAPPILTKKGYLEIYHGADKAQRYCLGAMLLDPRNPRKILARSERPLMAPIAPYEQKGFFGNVVFTDGVLVRGDELWIYYGASDSVTCLGKVELKAIWKHLRI
jgi:beta-1,2-mannobiose phosphorylase / 1,2-beta-oligomannan phosphorylase